MVPHNNNHNNNNNISVNILMRQGEGDAPGSASAMVDEENEKGWQQQAEQAQKRKEWCLVLNASMPMNIQKSSLCPPIELLRFDEALHLMSPPIEAGEHCHVCNRSAICLDYHAAWCRRCVTALLRERVSELWARTQKKRRHNMLMNMHIGGKDWLVDCWNLHLSGLHYRMQRDKGAAGCKETLCAEKSTTLYMQ